MLCSSLVFFSIESRFANSSRSFNSTAVYRLRATSSLRLRSATSCNKSTESEADQSTTIPAEAAWNHQRWLTPDDDMEGEPAPHAGRCW